MNTLLSDKEIFEKFVRKIVQRRLKENLIFYLDKNAENILVKKVLSDK